jgi:hypothetical protein
MRVSKATLIFTHISTPVMKSDCSAVAFFIYSF